MIIVYGKVHKINTEGSMADLQTANFIIYMLNNEVHVELP